MFQTWSPTASLLWLSAPIAWDKFLSPRPVHVCFHFYVFDHALPQLRLSSLSSLPKQIQPILHIPIHPGGRAAGQQSEVSRGEWGRGGQLPLRCTGSVHPGSCWGSGKISLVGKEHGTEVGQWCRKTPFEISETSVSLDWHRGKGLQATPVS